MTTSRIGRKPVAVPTGIEVKIQNHILSVKGPKGTLSIKVHPFVLIKQEGNEIKIHPHADSKTRITGLSKKTFRSIAGTTRANIYNLIHGVSQGFEERLELKGVGYRAQAKGKVLGLTLGFSHPADYNVPAGITIETPSQTEIIIKGMQKELVGEVAAKIRAIRPPEPYKGKGVRYKNEVIELKETKKK